MTRINTNVASLSAQANLSRANQGMGTTLARLSSGLRINKGADDPAGLIASETLRSEMTSISAAINNSQRASNVIATAEGALSEVAALLITIKELTVQAANTGAMSQSEISANQLQVDSAIDSITRISNATTFAGLKLLNGNMGYVTSGVDTTQIKALDIYGAQLGDMPNLPVAISGVTSAQKASLQYPTSALSTSVTLEVASNRGVEVFSFAAGYPTDSVAAAINAVTDSLGVEADYINSANIASGIVFNSIDYGSDAFVSVRTLPSSGGAFITEDPATGAAKQRNEGVDVEANINGAFTVGSGRNLTLNTTVLDMNLTLDASFGGGDLGPPIIPVSNTTFNVTGGGAMFQLGPHINSSEQTSIGIKSIAASSLGSSELGFLNEVTTGGAYSLSVGETSRAADIIEEAISQISVLRGRLGSFEKNTLQTNMNSLSITLQNVTSSESAIRDADFAAESANLTRAQILVQAGTSVLSMANQMPQSVLSLLQS